MNPSNKHLAYLGELQRQYQELKNSLPAHSLSSTMLLQLEELAEEIAFLQNELGMTGIVLMPSDVDHNAHSGATE